MKKEHVVLSNTVFLPEVERLLREGHQVELLTKGSSMMPFLRGSHDSVILKSFPEYHPGDIVLARLREGLYVLHRLKSINGNEVVLHGDGNVFGDEHCRPDSLAGKVIFIVRPSGRKVSVGTRRFRMESRIWKGTPTIIKRVILGVLRRLNISR